MNERTPPKSAHKPPVGRAAAAGTKRKTWPIVGAAMVTLLGVGAVVGTLAARSIVRGKLELIAREAGLQLDLKDVSVSPFGAVGLKGLVLKRPSGGAIVQVDDARAEFSLLRLMAGKRRPARTEVKGLALDVLLADGKPKEVLDIYRAARKVFPARAKDDDKDATQKVGSAISLEQGTIAVRMQGKGAQYLPQGLRIHDIAAHIDLAHGVGDLAAVVDGSVASKLSASLVAQKEGPPRLQARFAPEFRLQMPAGAPLPLGVDSVSVGGFGYDTSDGAAIENVVLRKGVLDVLSVKHLRPERSSLGARAEDVAFSLPAAAPVADDPKVAKGKVRSDAKVAPPTAPLAARSWSGTAQSLSLALDGLEGAEIPLAVKLQNLKVTIPGDLGVIGLAGLELRTDRLPGEKPFESLVLLRVEQPSVDLPWREDAMDQVPGGKYVWAAVTAAEQARLRQEVAEAAEEEIVDPTLPPEARAKKVQEKVAQKLRAAGVDTGPGGKPLPAQKGDKKKPGDPKVAKEGKSEPGSAAKSAVAGYVKPLREMQTRMLDASGLVQKLVDKLAQAPRLKVEVIGGRVGLVPPGADKPFGGVQDIQVSATPVLGDGTRGLLASVHPFDSERPWGELSADLITGPGPQLGRAKFKLAGGQFAQALRIVSSGVSVRPDSNIAVNLDVKPFSAPGKSLEIEGDFQVQKVGFDWWRLAPKPIDDFSASGKLTVSASAQTGTMKLDFSDLTVGEAHMRVQCEVVDLAQKPSVHLHVEMPKQDCGAAARSIPAGMISNIGAIEAKGEISWSIDMAVPLQNVYKATLDLGMDDETCEVTGFGNVNLDELNEDFVRPVNENGTILDDVLVGPQSGFWAPLAEMKPWTPWSMIATEDGAFYKHRGLRPGLLLRAIRLDLDYGRFVYGGSTITQQLVKNIYLTRAKNLSRKFEELLIVWQMEHRLQKDRILELYVNMIEFGPKLYGIQRAAQTYFGKDAKDLSPLESAFLAANKPCPRCGYARFAKKQWDPWWQERMIGIMNKMRDEGIISEEQFLAEAPYVPKFVGWPQTQAVLQPEPQGGVEE